MFINSEITYKRTIDLMKKPIEGSFNIKFFIRSNELCHAQNIRLTIELNTELVALFINNRSKTDDLDQLLYF